MTIYELALKYMNSVISDAPPDDAVLSRRIASALVTGERIPLSLTIDGRIRTGIDAMRVCLEGEFIWFAIDASLLNVGYAVTSNDLSRWHKRYPHQVDIIGMTDQGGPSPFRTSSSILNALMEAARIQDFMSAARSMMDAAS